MALLSLIFVLSLFHVIHESSTVSLAETTTPPVLARLAGDNRPPNAGRLEIFYNGVWGTVGRRGFDGRDAQVACYMLGFQTGVSLHSYFGEGSGQIWLDDVGCSGSELSLEECEHLGWGVNNYCWHYEHVSILCDYANCSADHSGCETVWNTDPVRMHSYLTGGTLDFNHLESFCEAWSNCSASLQDSGCTFADIVAGVMQNPKWSPLNDDTPMQRRYHIVVASLRHMCAHVYPDYEAHQQCFHEIQHERTIRNIVYREHVRYPFGAADNSNCWLPSVIASFYAELVQDVSVCDTVSYNATTAFVYDEIASITSNGNRSYVSPSCRIDMKELIDNATAQVGFNQCSVLGFFVCVAKLTALSQVHMTLWHDRLYNLKTPAEIESTCSAWINFRQCTNHRGCTLQDIYQYRLSLGPWSDDYQWAYNSSNRIYSFLCATTEEYQSCYECLEELDFVSSCWDIDYLKNIYEYEHCTRWTHQMACRYHSVKTECSETTANFFLRLAYQLAPNSTCHSSQVMNASLHEQITADSDCSESRYFSCLAQADSLQEVFFGHVVLAEQTPVSLCSELDNLTLCVGCSPANPRFPGNSLQVRNTTVYGYDCILYDIEPVTPLRLHELCNGATDLTTVDHEITTSALDAGKISVDSVWPLYGPVAGGTRVTITGQSLRNVASVYFGKHRGLIDTHRTAEQMLFATTPPANETARHLLIELVLNDGSRIYTNDMFEYRANPVFADIRPREHLAVGGTQVTVTGRNLDSVAKPRITLTVVVTWFDDDMTPTSSRNETDSEPCELPQTNANGGELLCRMPEVVLPSNLTEQLEKNESEEARHRRSNTEGPGVATYVSPDGRARADIYIGLILDGFTRYQNISSVHSDIKMTFTLPPVLSCESDYVDFDARKHKLISVKGRHMRRGCAEGDYDISLGVAKCVLVSLFDNQVDCRPPTNRPSRLANDTFCRDDDMPSLQVMIGNKKYHCFCVNYVPKYDIVLVVSLSVVLGFLFIVFIVAVWYCQSKLEEGQKESRDSGKKSKNLDVEDEHYSRRLPDDYNEARGGKDFDSQYEKQLQSNLSAQEQPTENISASKEDTKNEEGRYWRRDSDEQSTELAILDSQYATQLPDDHEDSCV